LAGWKEHGSVWILVEVGGNVKVGGVVSEGAYIVSSWEKKLLDNIN